MYKTILVPIDMAHVEKGKAMIDIAMAQGSKDTQIIPLTVIPDIPIWAANELPRNILDESLQSTQTELKAIANVSTLLGTV